jgi:hypothetical protein
MRTENLSKADAPSLDDAVSEHMAMSNLTKIIHAPETSGSACVIGHLGN